MSPRIRLLERFVSGGAPDRPERVRASIIANLGEVLNTVVGSAHAQPEMGLPGRNELIQLCPDENQQVRRIIEANATRYEPRLRQLTVSCITGEAQAGLDQHFLLEGGLHDGQRLRLLITIDGFGRFQIRQGA